MPIPRRKLAFAVWDSFGYYFTVYSSQILEVSNEDSDPSRFFLFP
jgi:hypothetical protein